MEIVILVAAMIVVGMLMGWIAGFIWKDRSPEVARRDYIVAVVATVITGLLDWFVVPAMGFTSGLDITLAASNNSAVSGSTRSRRFCLYVVP